MRKYVRKTRDVWEVWVHYGDGWEHEITEMTRAEGMARLREYRENCPQYASQLRKQRESINPCLSVLRPQTL